MYKLIYAYILINFIFTTTHLVPEEYSSIQAGIDAAVEGDTILVNQGIYYENIHLTKSIVLSSYAIFDDLENWTEYSTIFGEWQVINNNINNTIIDGSTATDDYGSCILIYSESGDCISPEIIGFTIRNGLGTMVDRDGQQQRLGGGILFDISNPIISYNQIENNGSTDIFSGGGAYGTSMEEDWSFNNRDLNGRSRCEVDEFNLENNLYDGNDALYGNTFANVDFDESINMSGSVFDVANCQQEEISAVWVYVEPVAEVELENISANACAITGNSAYVNPNIATECIEDGCGTSASNPFKTIDWALKMIMPSQTNQTTIYLANGTYSPQTGETFPIILPSYVNLQGEDEELTILDAMDSGRVVTIENNEMNILNNFTLTGGYDLMTGGGASITNSNPILSNITFYQNSVVRRGGAMWLNNSDCILSNVSIIENTSIEWSSGIHMLYSNPVLTNVLIADNTGGETSGAMELITSSPIMNNVTIVNNSAYFSGGLYLDEFSHPIINNSIIWGNEPVAFYGGSINYYGEIISYDFPINYSIIQDDWEYGDYNLNIDPLFANSNSGDYTLNTNSPGIDSGNPNTWYNDIDGSISDIGYTGGQNIYPSFINYDFNDVGDSGASIQFIIYNFKQTSLDIEGVSFNSVSFSSNTTFPFTIEPLHYGLINIDVNNLELGQIEDQMEISINQLPDDLFVSLTANITSGNILSGNLSGTYSGDYIIVGDIGVPNQNAVNLEPGTKFLFNGAYEFEILGTLVAIGTQSDSIIFDKYNNVGWNGFSLEGVSDATIFEYVRISGGDSSRVGWQGNVGGGLYLSDSSPIFNNVLISNNAAAESGGGMAMTNSSPSLKNVVFSNNGSQWGTAGLSIINDSNPYLEDVLFIENNSWYHTSAIRCYNSNLTLFNVTIQNNEGYDALSIFSSNAILNNITIIGNNSIGANIWDSNLTLSNSVLANNTSYSGGMQIGGVNSEIDLINVTIAGNTSLSSLGNGGGIQLLAATSFNLVNSIIWYNYPQSIDSHPNYNPIVKYSNIEDGWEGENNINIDPLFNNPQNEDYGLQDGSPCIDSGTADIDSDGVEDITDFSGSAPDMGAFEFIAVSMLGDLNADDIINILDIITLLNMIISDDNYDSQADLNSDGTINILDIVSLVNIVLDN